MSKKEKVDLHKKSLHFNLGYGMKFTIWLSSTPIVVFFIITFCIKNPQSILMVIFLVAFFIIAILRMGYNYVKWKEEEKSE